MIHSSRVSNPSLTNNENNDRVSGLISMFSSKKWGSNICSFSNSTLQPSHMLIRTYIYEGCYLSS